MASFQYKARNTAGKEIRGTLQAANRDRAQAVLQANKLTPIEIKEIGTEGSLLNRDLFSRINNKDLVLFSRQLSTMIHAGVPILESVRALQKQVEKSAFNQLLVDIAYDIEGGESLSNSLSRRPDIFSPFYIGVIRTGEASGRISQALATLAEYQEQNYIFTRKIRSAMMYPAFVLTGVVIVVVIMFSFVVPQLVDLFAEANVQLPLPTRILIAITTFFQNSWYLVLLIGLVIFILGRSYIRTPEGRYTLSTWALRVPILSTFIRQVYLARLTSVLHTLFSSNVPVIDSLRIAQTSISNRVFQRILKDTAEAIKGGAAISSVWEYEPYIPAMLTTMVGVGERSGEISRAFQEANRFFQRDVEDTLSSITVFLEPLLVILLGIGVAIIVAAVLLPIYNLVLVL